MAKKTNVTPLERASRAVERVGGVKAAVMGAGLLGGLAVGAALFGGWRKAEAETPLSPEPHVDDMPEAIGFTPATVARDDAEALHRIGIPTTLPIDDAPQNYTGSRAPDMAVDFIPGEDSGSSGTADTRDR